MRFLANLCFSGLLLMLLQPPSKATTIVGIWTEKKVTIAADSKQTKTDGTTRIACKVFEVRNLVFALAGLAEAQFAEEEAINIAGRIQNARQIVNQPPEISLIGGAITAIQEIVVKRGVSFDSKSSVDLIIAGMIGGKLQMFRVDLYGMQVVGGIAGPMATRRIPYPESRGHDGTDPNRGIETLGITTAIERFKKADPANWNKGEDLAVAKHLIEVETQDPQDSQLVGLPLTAVVIDKTGIHWKDRGACEQDGSAKKK